MGKFRGGGHIGVQRVPGGGNRKEEKSAAAKLEVCIHSFLGQLVRDCSVSRRVQHLEGRR